MGRNSALHAPDVVASASALAVENARKISPEALCEIEPERLTPRPTRRASRLHWCGSSGASVAAMAMIEPPGVERISLPVMWRPTGAPAIVNSRLMPKLACTKAPTV